MSDKVHNKKIRVDKWLWAARFYKTRAMATEAILGGRIHVNGDRVKPSRSINVGDIIKISKGEVTMTIEVLALAEKRGPAKIAQSLYQESDSSMKQREELAEQRRLMRASLPQSDNRPNKKQRRQIHRFRNVHDHS